MEFLDIFLLGVGIFTLHTAAKRLDMISAADSFKSSFEGVKAEGIPEESTSFRLRNEPLFLSPWNRGFGSFLNDRPILLVIVFILMIGIIFEVMILAMTYMKFRILLFYVIIAFMFHNGPDNLNIDEYYLRKITKKDPTTLNDHDVLFIERAASNFRSWSQMQALFGINFMLSIFLPIGLLFIEFLLLIALGFLYLGYKYSIGRAIFR